MSFVEALHSWMPCPFLFQDTPPADFFRLEFIDSKHCELVSKCNTYAQHGIFTELTLFTGEWNFIQFIWMHHEIGAKWIFAGVLFTRFFGVDFHPLLCQYFINRFSIRNCNRELLNFYWNVGHGPAKQRHGSACNQDLYQKSDQQTTIVEAFSRTKLIDSRYSLLFTREFLFFVPNIEINARHFITVH